MNAATHAQTARLDIHEIVRQLNVHLGPTLVAALAGTKDRNMPIRWAKADGPTPEPISTDSSNSHTESGRQSPAPKATTSHAAGLSAEIPTSGKTHPSPGSVRTENVTS